MIRWFGATDPHGPKRATRRLRREPGEKARPVSCFLGNGRGGVSAGALWRCSGRFLGLGDRGIGDRGLGIFRLGPEAAGSGYTRKRPGPAARVLSQ